MKKVLMLVAMVLGTTVMVNAQTAPAKTTPAKEVRAAKKAEKAAKITKAEPAKMEATKAKK
ncbi:hypothetical protein ACFX5F_01355 [Flavobacterium sp. ZS1P70]|uniref:Uncharacterized protein n=2 Tax=Flavobacterium TaxID=237 RepID=A0ABW6I1L0_9FLAO